MPKCDECCEINLELKHSWNGFDFCSESCKNKFKKNYDTYLNEDTNLLQRKKRYTKSLKKNG